ncbi:unnamed protein product [Caenorhabditis brenneri]
MGTDLPESTLERIKEGCKFQDEKYYLEWMRYMDLIAQVHSIVLTQKNMYVLRCWRGVKFGPRNRALEVESNLFRVTQNYFKQYIAPPDARIGRAVENLGKECLMEIVVYDEHIASLTGIKSGDFVALKNVHGNVNVSLPHSHTLSMHRGDGDGRNRGISIIPHDFRGERNLNLLREKIKWRLGNVTDHEGFKEFVTDEQFLPRGNQVAGEDYTDEEIEEILREQNEEGVGRNNVIEPTPSMRPTEANVSGKETGTFISTANREDTQTDDVEDAGEGPSNHEEAPFEERPSKRFRREI